MVVPDDTYERSLIEEGSVTIVGVDEVGRGCLAGPVVAGAVIYHPVLLTLGLRDSKQLSPLQRERLCGKIFECCDGIGLGWRSAESIDATHIGIAVAESMWDAVLTLPQRADVLIIDGNRKIPYPVRQVTVIKGDQHSVSVAAASIVAKVFRDRWMERWGSIYPEYQFPIHKGYPTEAHKGALSRFGPSILHRKTFHGVLEQK
ncbi:MAG: ribonuclease HII [Deltaproteobacteria bacterium]|nr:ribonuclease HII [Deltaproteobacteria bacterium]